MPQPPLLLLRPVKEADVPSILSLIDEVYAEYGCRLDAEHEEPHLLDPVGHFRVGGGEFWVVVEDCAVRATVAVMLHAEASELKSLYVHASLRRHGWGRRLTELAIAHAREHGRRAMFLWSDTRFEAAHRLYRRLGFRECGYRELNDSNNSKEYGFEMQFS
ncbi:MAG TPA: GNAT family N-acetyltransferase [Pyrinomonadaceae bacterium]